MSEDKGNTVSIRVSASLVKEMKTAQFEAVKADVPEPSYAELLDYAWRSATPTLKPGKFLAESLPSSHESAKNYIITGDVSESERALINKCFQDVEARTDIMILAAIHASGEFDEEVRRAISSNLAVFNRLRRAEYQQQHGMPDERPGAPVPGGDPGGGLPGADRVAKKAGNVLGLAGELIAKHEGSRKNPKRNKRGNRHK